MPTHTLRVIAVDGARVPARDELGRLARDRFWGLGPDGLPAAEDVPATPAVRRALRRGDLALATPPAPDTAPDTVPDTAPATLPATLHATPTEDPER